MRTRNTHAHTQTHTHMHARTHTHTRAHTNTHTHTHTKKLTAENILSLRHSDITLSSLHSLCRLWSPASFLVPANVIASCLSCRLISPELLLAGWLASLGRAEITVRGLSRTENASSKTLTFSALCVIYFLLWPIISKTR